MDTSLQQTPTGKRKGRLSEVVTTIITYRQKGLQTLLFHSLSILISVTILFLLQQIYFIFLPCLKALLWALLCGSALYPFKISLEEILVKWLDDLNEKNRSLCYGFFLLPFQIVIRIYSWTIEFISKNKFLFILFHFRFQIGEALKILIELLPPILSMHKGILPTFVIICIMIQLFVVIFNVSHNFFQLIFSFQFIPSLSIITFLYFTLNRFGIIGEIALIFFLFLFLLGFIHTVYHTLYETKNSTKDKPEELDSTKKIFGNENHVKFEKLVHILREKFSISQDSTDGSEMAIGKLFMVLLFTISAFAISEQLNVSNSLLALFCVHLVLKNVFNMIKEKSSTLIQFMVSIFETCKNYVVAKLESDVLFRILGHFFLQGDQIIKTGLRKSLDLLTSITLFLIVALMVVVFSVFLSVKIYGECYQAVHMLQNELQSIEFIQESINLTLNKVSDVDYLNNILNDKFNLRDDEKIFLNKMLFQFRENILPYLNTSRHKTIIGSDKDLKQANDNNGTLLKNYSSFHTTDLFQLGPSLMENFNQIVTFVSSQASSYLPVLKSFLSFSYAFIFVILDSSTFLLGFVLNFMIFALALFYLLSSSHKKYKPIEFLDNIVASLVTNEEENSFSQYVEEVINSIFAATLKISAFYGVYTWLVHSLFGIQICCIPAVIAAILAAVPLLNAYWASLPACIYLYYFDPNLPLVKSLSMFLIAILPSFIVDSSIYSDIEKGGHPYLTGLAITCGVVYYGVEGALFGPLWLCLLVIILNMCTEFDKNILNHFSPR